MTILTLLAGMFLGACGYASLLLVLAKRRAPAPTKHRRRAYVGILSLGINELGSDRLPKTRRDPPPMPKVKPARNADFWSVAEEDEPRVDYKWINLTGEEQ